MAEGPVPLDLLRKLEEACEGEPIDHIIFCCGVVVGQLLPHVAKPEHGLDGPAAQADLKR